MGRAYRRCGLELPAAREYIPQLRGRHRPLRPMPTELNPELFKQLRETLEQFRQTENPGDDECLAASGLCNRALSVDLQSAEAWLLKSQLMRLLGDAGSALSAAGMAVGCRRGDPECHYQESLAYSELG